MATQYPSKIDNNTSLPEVSDLASVFSAEVYNRLRNAIIAIETELGTKPSGVYTSVKNRFDTLENLIIGSSLELGGDLSGSLDNASVIGIKGILISSDEPTNGQALVFNGSVWAPTLISGTFTPGGDLAGTESSQQVISLTGDEDGNVSGAISLTFGTNPATSGTIRYDGGGVDGEGFINRWRGIDGNGITSKDVGFDFAYTRFANSEVQNVQGFGDWEYDQDKSPDFFTINFNRALDCSFSILNPQGDNTGFTLDSWTTGSPVIGEWGYRRIFAIQRYTNLAIYGARDHLFDPEDALCRGEGVFYFGNTEVNPDVSSPPVDGICLYVDSSDGYMKYIHESGNIINLDGSGSGGGGGGSPGGSNNEIQVKNGSAFAGATNVKAGSGYISIGSNPATSGAIRLSGVGSVEQIKVYNGVLDWSMLRTNSSGAIATFSNTSWDTVIEGNNLSFKGNSGTTGLSLDTSSAVNVGTSLSFGVGTMPSSGSIRFPYNGGSAVAHFVAKSSGGSDLNLITYGSGDLWTLGNTSQDMRVDGYATIVNGASSLSLRVANSNIATATGSVLNIVNALSIGSTPSATGSIRLTDGGTIYSRNGGGIGTDISLLSSSGAIITLGEATNVSNLLLRSSSYIASRSAEHYFQNAGGTTDWFKIDSSQLTSSVATFQFASTVSSPAINQALGSGTGQNLQIAAQSVSGAGTGGNLILSAGTGLGGNGVVRIAVNGTTGVQITPSNSGSNIYNVVAGATAVLFNQSNNTTNSATASGWTIQAQNATGTSATGGALNLTSGTGTSANGALKIQSGGTDVITVDSATQITQKATTFVQSGNSKITVRDTIHNVQTTDATETSAATWTIPNGISQIDAVVTAIKSDNTQGASYKRTITFRNNSGSVSTIGSVSDAGTKEDDTDWNCTIDNTTTTGRIRVTGKAATTIQWHVCLRRQEGIA